MLRDPYSLFLMRFEKLTEIQGLAIPVIESGRNCIITAPTGSGKTEAAILPLLKRIIEDGVAKGIFVIYITPLRALNRDLMNRLEWLCTELNIEMKVRHGDTTAAERAKQAASPPLLLVTTPESLQNLFLSFRLRESMKNVRAVIIDELHELYHNKRGAQLSIALERLEELSPNFQRIGISATIGNIEEASGFLFGRRDYKVIKSDKQKELRVRVEMPAVPRIKHREFENSFSLDDSALARIERISELIGGSSATIVFANTRQAVESLGSKLVYLGRLEGTNTVGIHHGSLDKSERIEIEGGFKQGRLKSIVATSSLELGIDIGRVDLVVQYGSPRQATRLIQRIGRGGHSESGVSKGVIVVSGPLEALESAAVVISALDGEIERPLVEKNALDVLANQLCAIVLEYKRIGIDKVYGMIARAYPYDSLEKELFEAVLRFAADERILKIDGGYASISSRSRKYFFGNISVIPDSPRFYVKDAARNRIISSLDERFVYSNLEEGSSFITRGVPWRVVSVEKDTVFVEPASEFESAIPDWDGEDIPVSHKIADKAIELLSKKKELEAVLDSESYDYLSAFADRQKAVFTPNNKRVVIEEMEDYAVIGVALGKLANEFLARMLHGLISESKIGDFSVRSTPYAIIIDFRYARRSPDLDRIFQALKKPDLLSGDMDFIENSDLFRYKFIQVAKLFGVVEKKVAITKGAANKVIGFYKDSVIHKETIRDLEKNYFDVAVVRAFLSDLRSGKISLEFRGRASPLSEEILRSVLWYRELLSGIVTGEEEIAEFKSRNNKDVQLLCTYCGLEFSMRIGLGIETKIECARCNSPMIANNREGFRELVVKRIEGKKIPDRQRYNEMLREASLISAYGNRAVIALSTYGIGVVTAARVLKMMRKDDSKFISDLLGAQKIFIKNSRFWKNKKF